MGEHAICERYQGRGADGVAAQLQEVWVQPIRISAAQAALGAMTDAEVAIVLMDRARERTPMTCSDEETVEEARQLGVWPPEGAG